MRFVRYLVIEVYVGMMGLGEAMGERKGGAIRI